MAHEYKKDGHPYIKTAQGLALLVARAARDQGVFFQQVIPIKGQTWLVPGCPNVKHFLPHKDGAYALRVGWEGDDYAGHIGMAYSPFVVGEQYTLVDSKDPKNTLCIKAGYVIPVKESDGLWYYRVEYTIVADNV